MALSNIFREPRREITESMVGVLIAIFFVGIFFGADYKIVTDIGVNSTQDLVLGMIVIGVAMTIGAFVLSGIIVGTHALGELICNRLEGANIHLRPRERR